MNLIAVKTTELLLVVAVVMLKFIASVCFILLPLLAVIAAASASNNALCPTDLSPAIDKIFSNCSLCYRSAWGVLIHQLTPSGPQVLYSLNQQRFFAPASNNKLLTTSSAFITFGPSFQISTPIYLSPDGRSVCLAGKGDPSITDTILNQVASNLKQQG